MVYTGDNVGWETVVANSNDARCIATLSFVAARVPSAELMSYYTMQNCFPSGQHIWVKQQFNSCHTSVVCDVK